MKKFALNIKNKIGFLGAIIIAAVVGGLSVAAVQAAIPDSSGVIHGCYKNSTGMLKVVDTTTGGACTSAETSLNWNQNAGPLAVAHILYDSATQISTLDSANSKNIVNFTDLPATAGSCIQVNFIPKYITGAAQDNLDGLSNASYGIKQDTGWLGYDGSACDSVPNTNVIITPPDKSYYAFFY